MFDAPRIVTSPTAALAQDVVGKEPHKMQLMKSSLFVEDQGSDEEIGMHTFKGFQYIMKFQRKDMKNMRSFLYPILANLMS